MTLHSAPDLSFDAAQAAKVLAPDGCLRVAINLGNPVLAQRHLITGELGGVSVVVATTLAERLGLRLELTPYDAAGAVFEALDNDAWDLAFMAVEPKRAEKIAFSPPYLFIDGTYLVRSEATFGRVADLDSKDRRIVVGRGAAYDLFLSRTLKHAALVRVPTSADAINAFLTNDDRLDAAAGIRQALLDATRDRDDVRVLQDRFVRIEQAIAVPKARASAQRYIRDFLNDMMLSGHIRAALDASGQDGAMVA